MIDPDLRELLRDLLRGGCPWPLFLYGPAGTGKTCAALAMLDYAPPPALYYTATGWASDFVQAGKGELYYPWRRGPVSQQTLRDGIDCSSLVVLDELGALDRVSDWHYTCVKDILDRRHGKPLIVCSNIDLPGIARVYDDRIADRLGGGTGFSLQGPSRRLSPR